MNEIIWMMRQKPPEVTRAQVQAVFDAVSRAMRRIDWNGPDVQTIEVERSDGTIHRCKVVEFIVASKALQLGEDGVIYTRPNMKRLRELRATDMNVRPVHVWTGMVASLDRHAT